MSQAGGQVLIVSFGERAGALQWIEETHCPFDMVVDEKREIYQAFGLKKLFSKVWGTSCLVYYAEAMLSGRSLPKPYENIHDDPHQMGGDFIVDSSRKVIFSHPSQRPSDRPSVDKLLVAITSNRSS